MSYWVQLHEPRYSYIHKKIASTLTKKVREVIEVNDLEKCKRNFLRAKIEYYVTQPLCKGLWVKLPPTKKLWVSFKYK